MAEKTPNRQIRVVSGEANQQPGGCQNKQESKTSTAAWAHGSNTSIRHSTKETL
jgi:hypothetical protein